MDLPKNRDVDSGSPDQYSERNKDLPKATSRRSRKTAMMQRWEQLIQFLREVRTELKKVNWPLRKDVVGSTIVVIISVFILSFFLGAVDITLQKLLTLVVR